MTARKIFALAGALLVLAIALLVVQGAVVDPANESVFECADPGGPTSGFVDEDQDGCPISIESYEEYREKVGSPQPVGIVGSLCLLGFLVALVVGTVVGLRNRRRRRGPAAEG